MKKLYALLLVLVMFTSAAFAQRNCGTMDHLEYLEQQEPGMFERMEKIERHTQLLLERDQEGVTRNTDIIRIPVVVHVVWRTSAENISDAQVLSQIQVLNEDFRRQNADASETLPQFLPVAADSEFEFCLATLDPNGNPTSGITRTQTSVSAHGTNNSVKFNSQGGRDAWPANQYLNMWVCNIGGGILGYAQFPGGSASTDGVVVDYRYFGTIGTATAPFNEGRTATHEVGHWLNLRHIWGDGNCSQDDFVTDTPPSSSPNYGCPLGAVKCNTLDMVQNYMDYTDDACMNIYTMGQKSRMRALFGPGGARVGLLSSHACGGQAQPTCSDGIQNGNETGVDCGGSCPPCSPPTNCLTYCASSGNSTVDEFIQSVTLGNYINTSGNNGGYASFNTSASFERGQTVSFSITRAWTGTIYPEYCRIWADWNGDGNFNGSGELVYDQGSANTAAVVSGSFNVPVTAQLGNTTFRVSMKYNGAPGNCEIFSWGEVEDYCIEITAAAPTCGIPSGLNTTNILNTSATLNWSAVPGATEYTLRARQIGQTTWASGSTSGTSINYTGLSACTDYEFQVSATCGSLNSGFSSSSNFTTTGCVLQSCDVPSGLVVTGITASQATLNWSAVVGAASYTVRARVLGTSSWSSGVVSGTSANFTGLTACTGYEFQVSASCNNGVESAFSASTNWITPGCTSCGPPTVAYVDNISTTSARFNWSAMPNATNYTVRFRRQGTTRWTTSNSTATSLTRTGLLCNTTYQYQIRTRCGNSWSAYGITRTFTTSGCARLEEPSNDEPLTIEQQFDIEVFPNPAGEYVTIRLPESNSARDYVISIYDMSGRRVYQDTAQGMEGAALVQIPVMTMANGLYLLEVVTNGERFTRRLAVAH